MGRHYQQVILNLFSSLSGGETMQDCYYLIGNKYDLIGAKYDLMYPSQDPGRKPDCYYPFCTKCDLIYPKYYLICHIYLPIYLKQYLCCPYYDLTFHNCTHTFQNCSHTYQKFFHTSQNLHHEQTNGCPDCSHWLHNLSKVYWDFSQI